MITNGINVPDASSSKEYIADPIGGWMYIVTTTVSVAQEKLSDFGQKIAEATKRVEVAQAELAELQTQKPVVDEAIFQMPIKPDVASSTPKM